MSKIESFEIFIPQLNRSRTVWVYLPDNYKQMGEPCPVIYTQDGQNLFYDKLTAYGMSWHADKALDAIYKHTGRGAIVVGVESNDKHRFSEYSPWKIAVGASGNARSSAKGCNRGGEGKKYAEFFAKTLKPTIDAKYNTDKERNATAIIGSSMGAFISCYLGLTYQRIYETMGLFSTATYFNQAAFNRFIKKTPQTLPQHALVYCGGNEGDLPKYNGFVSDCSLKLYKALAERSISCELLVNSQMKHNEEAWEVYFRKFAYDFLERYEDFKQSQK
ncbi:MAG: alpha/beta hydrolase-fold protein [Corallococcus sp.]|nr:alpha/beta hydrolase-fold protein [Corallococcus sp.]MCM1359506.1 alpha/beta hydrolase-fold protein [Corallococcus sp.]MCM1395098.1 alpha/beta hydrolase-fold protein [Corallococcus sp.]